MRKRTENGYLRLALRTVLLTAAFSYAACSGAAASAELAQLPTATPAVYIQAATPEPATVARYALTDEERNTVELAVMSEAGYASPELQRAVAQCIRNTAEATGQRPDEVVTAPGQYADLWDGDVLPSVKAAVSAAFDDGADEIDAPVQYFYAPRWMPSGTSEWHETLTFAAEIDGVRFFTAEQSE